MDTAALPYHEPDIITILILASFLLLLNIVNHVMDRITYAGLLGQVFLGIAYGTPGGKLLRPDVETVVVNLGYLGLLLLVYEGGLTVSFRSLKANLSLSLCVALTGIALPIGLSFILIRLVNATPLQAFAAGASLCSTSLGTTFTVMKTSRLNTTRMSVVLTSAAMMDDVVGLVMVQVISNLGSSSTSFSAVTVIRPIFVSLGFGLAVVMTCYFIVLPCTKLIDAWKTSHSESFIARIVRAPDAAFIVHTTILVGMVTGSTYSGTSNLFAAYLAGATISWWDSEVMPTVKQWRQQRYSLQQSSSPQKRADGQTPDINAIGSSDQQHFPPAVASLTDPAIREGGSSHTSTEGIVVFEKYLHQPVQRILKPFFFASIGFSIPITQMFHGDVVWRGLVYTLMMFAAKAVCGLWLMRWIYPASSGWFPCFKITKMSTSVRDEPSEGEGATATNMSTSSQPAAANTAATLRPKLKSSHMTSRPKQPVSLYPPSIVGCAMVARGEIGFLISSSAEANGIFGQQDHDSLFLIVTWAIMLCTIIGPIAVGLLVKRLKRLSLAKNEQHQHNVLGVWGIS